jgi:tripartite-type tricarboxylate transporter receptor subunit TctC
MCPYRGGAPAMTDLMGGQVQVVQPRTRVDGGHQSGQATSAAVTTATRSEVLPDVTTVAETLPGYEASAVQGIGAPKKTPAEVIDKLNTEINAGLADPRIKARFADLGGTVLPGSPADFGKDFPLHIAIYFHGPAPNGNPVSCNPMRYPEGLPVTCRVRNMRPTL